MGEFFFFHLQRIYVLPVFFGGRKSFPHRLHYVRSAVVPVTSWFFCFHTLYQLPPLRLFRSPAGVLCPSQGLFFDFPGVWFWNKIPAWTFRDSMPGLRSGLRPLLFRPPLVLPAHGLHFNDKNLGSVGIGSSLSSKCFRRHGPRSTPY